MKKFIDKIITWHVLKQVGFLVIVLLFGAALALLIGTFILDEPYITEMELVLENLGEEDDSSEFLKGIWYVLSRVTDPGYLGESENKGFAFVLTLFGWLVCTVLLIAIITNAYNVRIDKVERGQVRYRFKDHCIILGSNDMTVSLIRDIRKRALIDKNAAIIIHSEQDTLKLRSFIKDHLTKEEEKRLYFFRGQRESKEQLETLHLEKARLVFVLGEQDEAGIDSSNVECVNLIGNIKGDAKKEKGFKKLQCFMFLEEQTTFKLLQQYDTEIEIRKNIDLQTFNLHENWARMLLSGKEFSPVQNYSVVYDKVSYKEPKNLRFIIMGFNRMGQALAVQIARVAHFANGKKTIITVIDKIATELQDTFLSQYPGEKLMEDIEFDFREELVDSQQARKELTEWAKNDEIMAVAVCFRNPDASLFIGLNLPHDLYDKEIPVLIRQEYLHGFAQAINKKPKFDKVNFFGMLSSTCNLDFNRDDEAKALHEDYLKMLGTKRKLSVPSHQDWDQLPEHYRWSNRYPVDIYPVKKFMLKKESKVYIKKEIEDYLSTMKWIRSEYFDLLKKKKGLSEEDIKKEMKMLIDSWDNDKQNIAADIELMAEIEHSRWIAEKVLAGWIKGKPRDNDRLIHPDIVPYTELTEEKKMYDRQPSIRMFELKPEK